VRDDPQAIEETLAEMTFAWIDIEQELERGTMRGLLPSAFRVEAVESENDFGDPQTVYTILFDAEDARAREAARKVRDFASHLHKVIREHVQVWDGRYTHMVRVVPTSVAISGLVCGRKDAPPPKEHIDVSDVPVEKPNSNVPLTQRDGYWLTPIEVPFYDALRETGLVFAVQPWIQGVETRFRLDFLIFYDGGMVAVELDGHESHKTKEQRIRDAKRDRWFMARGVRTLRWTGTEVHANAQECVKQLLDILRGTHARP